jgi:hypothetical protein
MKDRSGDEVSNSAGSVKAQVWRPPTSAGWDFSVETDRTKPGQAGFCPVLHVILIAPTILFYHTSSSTFVLVLGHNKQLETRPALID